MRYYTWIEGKYHRGGNLLSEAQIAKLSRLLVPRFQVFASIQNYDEKGHIVSSPLYMDLDGDLATAQQDCQYAAHLIDQVMNVEPLIFFSGNKGFHLVVPYFIEHPYCHYISKHWSRLVSKYLTTLDNKVYRSRSMFRIENSKASKNGYYKIRLTIDELHNLSIEEILKLAESPRDHNMPIPDMSNINKDIIAEAIIGGEKLIPDLTTPEGMEGFLADFEEDFTPCLKRLLYEPPLEGYRNTTMFVLAKFLKRCDFNLHDGLNIVLSQRHWSEYEKSSDDHGGVSKVFKTIYQNNRPANIGCRGDTPQAELMRQLCDEFCFFNKKMPTMSEMFKK